MTAAPVEQGSRERPILFSGPMVRAILDGSKTQTRRVVTKAVTLDWLAHFTPEYVALRENGLSPYGYAGDRLWVRETFFDHGELPGIPTTLAERVEYRAEPWDRKGDPEDAGGWTPSIHMPRAFSRLTLELTAVRVERVQEIRRTDAEAEGIDMVRDGWQWKEAYRTLWDSLNAKRGYSWDSNPWVWCLTFTKVAP